MSMTDIIKQKLEEAFQPTILNVINQSHLHAGHAGDDGSGESHFKIEIQSPALDEFSPVIRQRKIHKVLENELKIIHALSIKIVK